MVGRTMHSYPQTIRYCLFPTNGANVFSNLKPHIDSGFLAIAIFTGKDMVYLL